ncbi:PLAC8 family-domain-containing protein [Aspergillus spectabilis]
MNPSNNDWSSGLAECCSPLSTCLLATTFPCYLFRYIQHRSKHPTTPLGTYCGSDCMAFCALSCCLLAYRRNQMRENYKIPGSVHGDCLKSCLCLPCTLVQMDKQVDSRTSDIEYQSPSPMVHK